MAARRVTKAAAPPVGFAEIGRTGLAAWGGHVQEELLRDLQGTRGARVYREMRDNDAVVGAIMFAIHNLAKQVAWSIMPGTDALEDQAAAEFIRECLFEDMSSAWPETLTEILSFLPFGWAYLETVYKRRLGPSEDPAQRSLYTDGRIGWRKWALRGQETLSSWELDDAGGVQAMVQVASPRYTAVSIPIEVALLFRVSAEKNNPEGRSILRTAYRCFTPDHDVLTRRGWVPIADVTMEDLCATLNPETDRVEWRGPTERQTYQHTGPLVHAHAKHLDLLVTGNHDLWVRPGVGGPGMPWGFLPADRVTGSMRMRRDLGTVVGEEPEWLDLPEVRWADRARQSFPARRVPMDAWADFLGFWLADGTAGYWGPGHRWQVAVYQKEGAHAVWLRRVLKRCGFAWHEVLRPKDGVIKFSVKGAAQIESLLAPIARPHDKRVPPDVRTWSPRLITRLLDAHQRGDGSVVDRTRLHFTKVHGLADDLHELAVLSGAAASLNRNRAGVWWMTRGRVPTTGSRIVHLDTQWYDGPVHCLTVPPHHLLYVRRNGKGCWAGNSWYFKKRMEEIEGVGVERDLAGLPVLEPPASMDIWNATDPLATQARAAAERFVRNVRRDLMEGVVLPAGWKFSLLSTGGRRNFDTTAIINRYDQRITMSVLADFIMLGSADVGSYALATAKTSLFAAALTSFLDSITGVVNRHAIPRLLAYNGLRVTKAPSLAHGNVSTPNLQELGEYVSAIAGAGVPVLPEDGDFLRQAAGMPTTPETIAKRRAGIQRIVRKAELALGLDMPAVHELGATLEFLRGRLDTMPADADTPERWLELQRTMDDVTKVIHGLTSNNGAHR